MSRLAAVKMSLYTLTDSTRAPAAGVPRLAVSHDFRRRRDWRQLGALLMSRTQWLAQARPQKGTRAQGVDSSPRKIFLLEDGDSIGAECSPPVELVLSHPRCYNETRPRTRARQLQGGSFPSDCTVQAVDDPALTRGGHMAGKTGAKKSSAKGKRASETPSGPTEIGSLRKPLETSGGAVLPKGAAGGSGTATGTERINDTKGIPTGKDAGSTREIAGGNPVPDDQLKGTKPKGLQAEPAVWALNGSLEPNTVSSPSGPVVAQGATQEEVDKKLSDHRENVKAQIRPSHRKLTEEHLSRMTRAEVSAVARDRGYQIPDAGHRVSRAAFLRAQDEDEYAVDEDKF